MERSIRYEKAIVRNLYEVALALIELKALIAFEVYSNNKHIFTKGENFFSISFKALHNDMIAHTIKVLDKDTESTTFWYILNKDKVAIEELESYSKEKIDSLDALATKLKIIRDKTHFHIDKNGVLDPSAVWKRANIKGKELGDGLNYLFSILNDLHQTVFNKSFLFRPEDYDDTDLAKLLDLANSNNLIEVVPTIEESKRSNLKNG